MFRYKQNENIIQYQGDEYIPVTDEQLNDGLEAFPFDIDLQSFIDELSSECKKTGSVPLNSEQALDNITIEPSTVQTSSTDSQIISNIIPLVQYSNPVNSTDLSTGVDDQNNSNEILPHTFIINTNGKKQDFIKAYEQLKNRSGVLEIVNEYLASKNDDTIEIQYNGKEPKQFFNLLKFCFYDFQIIHDHYKFQPSNKFQAIEMTINDYSIWKRIISLRNSVNNEIEKRFLSQWQFKETTSGLRLIPFENTERNQELIKTYLEVKFNVTVTLRDYQPLPSFESNLVGETDAVSPKPTALNTALQLFALIPSVTKDSQKRSGEILEDQSQKKQKLDLKQLKSFLDQNSNNSLSNKEIITQLTKKFST